MEIKIAGVSQEYARYKVVPDVEGTEIQLADALIVANNLLQGCPRCGGD